MFKKVLKNQRGLTLIELLAVVVILGIISAIAVPSIGGIIDNSKKDAHVSNAQQMINSTKLAVAGEPSLRNLAVSDVRYVPLGYLVAKGYIEPISDPDGNTSYEMGTPVVDTIQTVTGASGTPTAAEIDTATGGSYVMVTKSSSNLYTYAVKLINAERGVQASSKLSIAENSLDRDRVRDN